MIGEDTPQRADPAPVARQVGMGRSQDAHQLRFGQALSGRWLSHAASVHLTKAPPAVDVLMDYLMLT